MEYRPASRERLARSSSPRLAASNQAGFDTPLTEGEERDGGMAREYGRTLWRGRWPLALLCVLGVLGSFLFDLSTLPVYRARTSLDIQSMNADFMDMRTVAPTGDNAGSAEAGIQTQIKLLESDTLLDRTLETLRAQPHPQFIEREDLLSKMKRGLHLVRSEPLSYNDLLDNASKHVKVKPLGMTRLVEITCDSWSPAFSALFCNTLTEQYKEADLETRSTEAQKTSDWLTRQVADVRQRAEDSQKKLQAATGGDNLVLTQGTSSVGEDRLRQMQGELVRAQADRMEKEAQFGLISHSSEETLPGVLDSPSYRVYQQKLAELRSSVAQLVPPLTEQNPKVIHLRSQIRDTEATMAAERAADIERVGNEFSAARHREALLSAAYHAEESSVSSDLGKAAQVNLLRREVESEQQLYQTLLQRAKEAGFASALQATTIRVVDAARKPKAPISPRRGTAAGVGLMLGSVLGVGLAFFRERNANLLRAPGDVTRFLGLQELGVIPSAEGGGRLLHLPRIPGPISLAQAASAEDGRANALSLAGWNDHFSIVAEAYRNATFSILLAQGARARSRVYVISSPSAGEGKSTVSSNLAVALSKSRLRVILIDGDLRKPGLHKTFRVANDVGLRDILRGEVELVSRHTSSFAKQTTVPNLSVITSGTGREEVVELLHSSRGPELLHRLAREFDVVLIDTPPMLHMADARIFASHADAAILVFRAGVTTHEQAAAARDLFVRDRVRLLGTILNDFNPAREGRSGYYESYFRYKRQIEGLDGAGQPGQGTAVNQ